MNTQLIKPLLRGHFHQAAFFMALGACLMLLAKAQGIKGFTAALIYSLSLLTLFGASALYHRPQWNPNIRQWMKRLDHSAIFILISGTITPICLLALPAESGTKLLIITWMTALFGIIQSFFWVKAPKWVSSLIYLCAGWLALSYLPEMKNSLPTLDLVYVIIGGVIYSIGAIIYAFKKPNPFPSVFGYHEIFHLLVIIAAFFHFMVVNRLINNPF